MTLPDERYRSIKQARALLEELCNPQLTPRIAAGIRDRARGVLRHYPSELDMQAAAHKVPEIFAAEMEQLYRMIVKHSLDKDQDS